jgi:hypothetical protein
MGKGLARPYCQPDLGQRFLSLLIWNLRVPGGLPVCHPDLPATQTLGNDSSPSTLQPQGAWRQTSLRLIGLILRPEEASLPQDFAFYRLGSSRGPTRTAEKNPRTGPSRRRRTRTAEKKLRNGPPRPKKIQGMDRPGQKKD